MPALGREAHHQLHDHDECGDPSGDDQQEVLLRYSSELGQLWRPARSAQSRDRDECQARGLRKWPGTRPNKAQRLPRPSRGSIFPGDESTMDSQKRRAGQLFVPRSSEEGHVAFGCLRMMQLSRFYRRLLSVRMPCSLWCSGFSTMASSVAVMNCHNPRPPARHIYIYQAKQ